MSKAHILWIEGRRSATPAFLPQVRGKGHTVEVVPSGKVALARLEEADPTGRLSLRQRRHTSGVTPTCP